MSEISELVKKLREYGNKILFPPEARNVFNEAADTIEALFAKLQAANMEQSDMVSINKLIKEIDKEINGVIVKDTYSKGKNAGLRKVKILVEEQTGVHYGGGWIPCEDKLPEEKQLIWVSVEYKTGGTESIEGIFIDGQPCRMNGVGLGLIAKAWMPRYIPEPYRHNCKE